MSLAAVLRIPLCALALSLSAGWAGGAETVEKPLLSPLFGDEAVLQRDRPVTVWGWAEANAQVTITLSGDGLSAAPVSATAGADGRWQAQLGPFAAGGPYTLEVNAGQKQAAAHDVLLGDVWLCGGQSNMEFVVKNGKDAEAEKNAAKFPQIRHLKIEKRVAGTPETQFHGAWKVCSPEEVGNFTAVGYFFARHLNQELHVPIGLVNSTWGGTSAEAWTSYEALKQVPDYAGAADAFRTLVAQAAEQREKTGKDYSDLISEWYAANDPGSASDPGWAADDLPTADWSTVTLPAVFEDSGAIPKAYDGTIWLRREFDVPAALLGKPGTLSFGKIDDADTTWVNGKVVGALEQAGWARNYRIGAGALKAGRNVIAIRVTDFSGKCGFTGKPEDLKLLVDNQPVIALNGAWKLHLGTALSADHPIPVRIDRGQAATSLYNGMIAPLVPLTLTGAIWYQGENNAGQAYKYRGLLPALIGDWRARFAQGDFPFLIVQLANYTARLPDPGEAEWAELREAQALTARNAPHSGLAVTIDIGDATDIHPKNKQEVGRRLGLIAQATVYDAPLEYSGPQFKDLTIQGKTARLSFDHLGGGLISANGEPLTGFAIAGEDKVFVWASARIDGDSVLVMSPKVAKPVAVRYAWAANPACNLANRAKLPAVPFRTDDWPGKTWPQSTAPATPAAPAK